MATTVTSNFASGPLPTSRSADSTRRLAAPVECVPSVAPEIIIAGPEVAGGFVRIVSNSRNIEVCVDGAYSDTSRGAAVDGAAGPTYECTLALPQRCRSVTLKLLSRKPKNRLTVTVLELRGGGGAAAGPVAAAAAAPAPAPGPDVATALVMMMPALERRMRAVAEASLGDSVKRLAEQVGVLEARVESLEKRQRVDDGPADGHGAEAGADSTDAPPSDADASPSGTNAPTAAAPVTLLGATLHPRLALARSAARGAHVVARAATAAGAVLATVPFAALMGYEAVAAADASVDSAAVTVLRGLERELRRARTLSAAARSATLSVLLVLHARHGDASGRWRPYLDALPDAYGSGVEAAHAAAHGAAGAPAAWVAAARGTGLAAATAKAVAWVDGDVRPLLDRLCASHPAQWPPAAAGTDAALRWAASAWRSRAMAHPLPASAGSFGAPRCSSMVPIGDFFNHRTGALSQWRLNGQALELVAGAAVAAGSEVCITYGADSDTTLLCEYGFVERRVTSCALADPGATTVWRVRDTRGAVEAEDLALGSDAYAPARAAYVAARAAAAAAGDGHLGAWAADQAALLRDALATHVLSTQRVGPDTWHTATAADGFALDLAAAAFSPGPCAGAVVEHGVASVSDVPPVPDPSQKTTAVHRFALDPAPAAALNARLAAAADAFAASASAASLEVSNSGGGLHSPEAPVGATDPIAAVLRDVLPLLGAAPDAEATAWLNVGGQGAFNTLHDHDAAAWSLVYYAAAPVGSGELLLRFQVEPRSQRFTYLACAPKSGELWAFPGYLPHAVLPNASSTAPRVSVAVNVFAAPAPSGGRRVA